MSVVFLVGPGGVGKTTVGSLVAERVGMPFVDLDKRFCDDIGLIPTYVDTNGYREYCEANSGLAEAIANDSVGGLVLATSSGFLAHDGCDDIVERNLALIRRTGLAIFLMPATDIETAARKIAFRQAARYPDRDLAAEYSIALARCGRYQVSADEVVVADGEPDFVADLVIERLATRA